jgi:hypothetical protein
LPRSDNGGGLAAFIPRFALDGELQPGKVGLIKPDDSALAAGTKSDRQVLQLHEISPGEKVRAIGNFQTPRAICFQQNVFPLVSIRGSQDRKSVQRLDASAGCSRKQDISPSQTLRGTKTGV